MQVQDHNGFPDGTTVLSDNNAQVQDFVSKLNGKLSSLHLFGCSVASGAAGKALLNSLFSGLGGILVDGYDDTVFWPTDLNCDGSHFCTFGSYVVGSSGSSGSIGGFIVPINRLALLAPYLGLVFAIIAATTATVYVTHLKLRKEKQ